MGTNANKVFVGMADQSATTGALARGAVIAGTSIPSAADIDSALALIANFSTSGYVSEEGATLTTEISTTDLREWNRSVVRRLLDEFTGTITLTLIQLDEESAKQAFGADNVTVAAATSTTGTQIRVALGATIDKPQAWALRMKDGDARMLVIIPNGQVTSGVEITFVANEPISLPVTISANDDGTGHSIYIFTDDGVIAA